MSRLHKALPVLLVTLALVLAACGPAGHTPEELASTAQVLASTWVAETVAAMPTETPQPTATDTPEPTATETPLPTETPVPSDTPFPTQVFVPTNTFRTDFTAPLRFDNNTDLTIYVIVEGDGNGNFYYEARFQDSHNVTVPQGNFTYLVWIGDVGPFSGSFFINNVDKHTLVFETDKVKFLGP